MFKYLWSFFKTDKEDYNKNLSLDEALSVLSTADLDEVSITENPEIRFPENYSCEKKTGVITSCSGNSYVIDKLYTFDSENEYEIGSNVSFTIFIKNQKLQITNVALYDAWDTDMQSKQSSWDLRTIIGQVKERKERKLYVSEADVWCDLNVVKSSFVPIVGDWIQLEVRVERNENVLDLAGNILEVIALCPLRVKISEGKITSWDVNSQFGDVDRSIFFNIESCCEGYLPRTGDTVVMELIESTQGRCSWRALKLIPSSNRITVDGNFLDHDYDRSLESKYGLSITEVPEMDLTYKDTHSFSLYIINIGEEDLCLSSVQFEKPSKQYELLNTPTDKIIVPKESLELQFLVTALNLGKSRETFVLDFKDIKVKRQFSVQCKPKLSRNQNFEGSSNYKKRKCNFNLHHINNKDIVYGQKVVAPPRFIAKRLPEFAVPQAFNDLYLGFYENNLNDSKICEALGKKYPWLLQNLTYDNYEHRFHTLLNICEMHEMCAMRQYDQTNAVFIKNGEYLMLEIENLHERRPSIMVGDRVKVWSSYEDENTRQYEGYIHKTGAKHIYLKFDPVFHENYNGEDYAVYVIGARTVYKRMHQAVKLIMANLGKKILFPNQVETKQPQVNLPCIVSPYATLSPITKENVSRNALLAAIQRKKQQDMMKKQLEDHPEYQIDWFNPNLNEYQKAAVANILLGKARPLPYIIFGPPGTGKTITIVETILQILHQVPHSRLMVATPSNSSADLIATRLIESGILRPGDLVRLVAYRCVKNGIISPKLTPYSATLEIAREGTHGRQVEVQNGIRIGLSAKVIGRHRVTVGTCVALGQMYNCDFPKGHFTHFLIDEAGQAVEPEISIPLAFLDRDNGQIILAGDPLQLGPVIQSRVAETFGYHESYLERLISRFPYAYDSEGFPKTGGYDPKLITKLLYNYRSLPEILKLPNNMFYRGELKATISSDSSAEAASLQSLREILPQRLNGVIPAVVFHGLIGENFQTEDCPSWFNPCEASQVFYYLNELIRLGFRSNDIGIITPYLKQVQQIRALINEAEFEVPKVGTVEEFQGQEFKVIILSTVRSSDRYLINDHTYNLGFVASPRRLNVALTRAKVLIIIIGNPNLLYLDIYWRNVIDYCFDIFSYCGCDFDRSKYNLSSD